MAGIRDMSVLETAPKGRLPVRTAVLERNNTAAIDAIEKELARNGQVPCKGRVVVT